MYIDSPTIDGLLDGLAGVQRPAGTTLMVFLPHQPEIDLQALAEGLHQRGIDAFGATFPGIVANHTFHTTGALGIPVKLCSAPQVITEMDTLNTVLQDALPDADPTRRTTALMLYAAPGFDINQLIQQAFDQWGPTVNYLGAGAGVTDFADSPPGDWVFSGPKTAVNSAVLAMLENDCSINLKHGWKPIAGPLVASRCEGQRICDLNWQSAYEVYRDALPSSLNIRSPRDLIDRISSTYPLAIAAPGQGEPIIRTPYAVDDDGSLLMVCNVAENSTLYVAQAETENLMREARNLAPQLADVGSHSSLQLLITCIARCKFLGAEKFQQELDLIQAGSNLPLTGVVGLGEIASNGERFFDVHNKAMALAKFHA